MKSIFLLAFFITSCTKYAKVEKHAFRAEISDIQMEISQLIEVDWHVGQRREETVSQSFIFVLQLPKISPEHLDYLQKERGIDSWVLRIINEKNSKSYELGSVYVPIKPKQKVRAVHLSSPSNIGLKIMYAAAYASERFRSFKCPAFNHNLKISDIKIEGKNEPFSITIGLGAPFNEKPQKLDIRPNHFNGGNSLLGEYFVEIAPYNSIEKKTYSNFKRIPMYIKLANEKQIFIKNCLGVHEEYN